jgi:hypothetical protein
MVLYASWLEFLESEAILVGRSRRRRLVVVLQEPTEDKEVWDKEAMSSSCATLVTAVNYRRRSRESHSLPTMCLERRGSSGGGRR